MPPAEGGGMEIIMKTKKINQIVGKYIKKMAKTVAKLEANSVCPYLTYQPVKPDSVKKMRKF